MQLEKLSDGYIVKANDNEFLFSDGTLCSVKRDNVELLDQPLHYCVNENGNEITSFHSKSLSSIVKDDEITIISTMESELAIFSAIYHIFFDGFIDVDFSVSIQGFSVKECLHLESRMVDKSYKLNKVWLEIPFKKDIAKYFGIFPRGKYTTFNGEEKEDNFCEHNSIPKSGMYMPFRSTINLHNGNYGFCFYCESDEFWQNENENQAEEIINNKDNTTLRVRFLDSHPKTWVPLFPKDDVRQQYRPITFKYSLQPTPTVKNNTNMFGPHILHLDCFVKIGKDFYDFLINYKDVDGGNGFDKIKRLGVDTLIIHEKWNEIQNHWILTDRTEEQAKLVIEECHKRGIKVVPYFGYEISTLSPYYHNECHKYLRINPNFTWNWYRQPAQRNSPVCYNNPFGDIWVNGVSEVINRLNFDGIYLDGTANATGCCNSEHGCGYTDSFGKEHLTYEIHATRDLMRKLSENLHKYGKTIDCHISNCYNFAAIGFIDSIYTGEDPQAALINNVVDTIPQEYMQAAFNTQNYGVPVQLISYNNETNWTFNNAITLSLLHGITPRPNSIDGQLELISKVWKAIDKFPIKGAKWEPYFNGNDYKISDKNLLASTLINGKKRLVFLGAINAVETNEQTIDFGNYKVTDAFTDEVISTNGKITVNIDRYDLKILILKEF